MAAADFDGPVESRHCTDVLMLLLIIGMWVSMTAIGIQGAKQGDYRRIVYPMDYDGNICGTKYGAIDMTNYPYLYTVNAYGGGVCVKSCPFVSSSIGSYTDIYTLVTYDGIYQATGSKLPANYISVADYSDVSSRLTCTQDMCYPNDDPEQSWTSKGVDRSFGFAYYAADSYEVLWRCFFTANATNQIDSLVHASSSSKGIDPKDSANKFFSRLYADVYVARWYILGFGLGVCMAISFVYIFIMRLPLVLATMIWVSVFLTIALFVVAGYYTEKTAIAWSKADPQVQDSFTINVARIAGYVLYGIGGFLFLMACCLRRQIAISIGCVKTAGKAINNMLIILAVPVVQAVGLFLFCIIWMYYAVSWASLGQITLVKIPVDFEGVQITIQRFEWSDSVVHAGWYLLFCLFWTANFIVAMGDLIVALCVAKYYFTRDKWKVGSWTVTSSVWQVVRYHAGTAAFGSLLIAIVQLIRAMIAKAQRAAKNSNNTIARIILCCCQCCFCVMESCLKFISKNAYIQCAIFSTAFCNSCRKAFFLIARNVARISAISYVSGALLIIGKLFISSVTTLLAYYFIVKDLTNELNSIAGPTLFVFLMSYWVSDFFMGVFDIAITAVLHCFIADEEMFSDHGFAEGDLIKFIDKHGAEED